MLAVSGIRETVKSDDGLSGGLPAYACWNFGRCEMDATTRLTGRLVAAGRALTGVSQENLAAAAAIPLEVYLRLEAGGAAWLAEDEARSLGRALEAFGVVIVPEGDGMGAGVRLKFTRQDVRNIVRLETEGGIVGSDDVP
jgi:hypothetical protein